LNAAKGGWTIEVHPAATNDSPLEASLNKKKHQWMQETLTNVPKYGFKLSKEHILITR
jgi:hypothetical protein